MIVLGIETSCDETAASVVNEARVILSNPVLSQLEDHAPYGGIVPEIAARAHLENVDHMVAKAMREAGVKFQDLDGVAATGGPGLIGGVLVGVMCAKAIALSCELPFLAVNHLEGHALSARLSVQGGDNVEFPYLLLLVSGGHCQILAAEGVGRYRRLGSTLDDALGEAFDKVAKMLGLGFPGGPEVEKAALNGDPARFKLPRPMKGRPGCHFSFSGLKTAVRHAAHALPEGAFKDQDVADLCAGFQAAAGDVLVDRLGNGLKQFQDLLGKPSALVVAGGVAANQYLRRRLEDLAKQWEVPLAAPPLALCTDNAAMIAWAGIERLQLGLVDSLDFAPRPRWPLDPDAPPAAYAGVKA